MQNWEWDYLHQRIYINEDSALKFDADILSFVYSADGSKLALYNANGQLVIHDHRTGEELHRYQIYRDLERLKYDSKNARRPLMDFCSDGKHVAVKAAA